MSDETEIRKSDGYPERMCPGCGAARREGAAWWYVCGTFWHPPTGQRKVSVKCRDRQLATAQSELAAAQAACAEWQEAVDAIRDRVLNERDAMAEMDFGSDRVNAVLSIIDDVMPCAPLGQALLDRLAQAEAIVEKYPKTKDGVHVVPGMTVWPRGDCFVPDEEGGIVKLVVRDSLCGDIEELDFSKCSSTKEAALAAQEAAQ